MVNVMKGILVSWWVKNAYNITIISNLKHFSDGAMKQFLLHLDDTLKLGRKFIIQDLDENHLFISTDILDVLQAKIDDLMDQISFPLAEKGQ